MLSPGETGVGNRMENEQVVENEEIVESDPLNDLFSDDDLLSRMDDNPVTSTSETEEPKQEETQVEPKQEEPQVEPKQEESKKDPVQGLLAAAQEERRKRQLAEQQLQQLQQAQKKPVEFNWDNPEETIKQVTSEISNDFQNKFLDMSESLARSRYDDYDAARAVFDSMVQQNPAIIDQMLQQPDPAGWGYNLAKQQMLVNEIGSNPSDYQAKLKAKHYAEFQAEMDAKNKATSDTKNSLPPSAKSMTDKASPKVQIDDDPLGSLFPGHRS